MAASAGDTVTLAGNVDLGNETLLIDKNVTIDGAGFTLSTNNQYGIFVLNRNLTVKNLEINVDKQGTTGFTQDGITRGNAGATGIALEGGTIDVSNTTITVKGDGAAYGIYLGLTTSKANIGTGNTINATTSSSTAKGYVLGAEKEAQILDSTVAAVTSANAYSLRINENVTTNILDVFAKADELIVTILSLVEHRNAAGDWEELQ